METAIARRYGLAAAAEWQVLLNQFNLGEGFALVILRVPDRDGAALCRSALEGFLAERSLHLGPIEPEDPGTLRTLTVSLLGLPEDPGRGAVWVSAVIGETAPDRTNWDAAWRQALGSLNQQRNPFRQRFNVPVIFVGAPWLATVMRETAPDLWSVRALSLHIEPQLSARTLDRKLPEREVEEIDNAELAAERSPDPEMAMRAAAVLRGKAGQERALADTLVRAAIGFAARRAWAAAEEAWREAAASYRHTGSEGLAAKAWTELGNLYVLTGRSNDALATLREGMAIRERLVRHDPGNSRWQQDLSFSHDRIGDVLEVQGDLTGASAAYRQGMAIRERLTRQYPDKLQWQRDLSVSHDHIGHVLEAQGDLTGAIAAFRQAMGIRERLTRQDPDNAQWQRDLSISHNRIGEVLEKQGDLPAALQAVNANYEIAERLARLDPGNAEWQRDLLVPLATMARLASRDQRQADADNYVNHAVALAKALVTRFPNSPRHLQDLAVVEGMLRRIQDAGA